MGKSYPRRRVIRLIATSAVACVAAPRWAVATERRPELYSWHGFALGAELSLQLYHNDAVAARRIIDRSVKIIENMEQLFSLYRENSSLSILNRDGVLSDPPQEFVDLLQKAHRFSRMTSGAFDITVQSLWQFYQAFFSRQQMQNPSIEQVTQARRLVDYRKLSIAPEKVAFDCRGMAATLNGIAQGYATDIVSDYLKRQGLTSVLVDIGEYRALGPRPDASPWRIALADPENPGEFGQILEITQGAVATSSPLGDRFTTSGIYNHIFDPHSGYSASRYSSVTVMAPTATVADALSTAFCVMAVGEIEKCLKGMPEVKARLTFSGGRVVML